MDGLDALFRWLHVFVGIIWIGHLYFFNFVNGPTQAKLERPQRKRSFPSSCREPSTGSVGERPGPGSPGFCSFSSSIITGGSFWKLARAGEPVRSHDRFGLPRPVRLRRDLEERSRSEPSRRRHRFVSAPRAWSSPSSSTSAISPIGERSSTRARSSGRSWRSTCGTESGLRSRRSSARSRAERLPMPAS